MSPYSVLIKTHLVFASVCVCVCVRACLRCVCLLSNETTL
jgi:hypothetical protein